VEEGSDPQLCSDESQSSKDEEVEFLQQIDPFEKIDFRKKIKIMGRKQ